MSYLFYIIILFISMTMTLSNILNITPAYTCTDTHIHTCENWIQHREVLMKSSRDKEPIHQKKPHQFYFQNIFISLPFSRSLLTTHMQHFSPGQPSLLSPLQSIPCTAAGVIFNKANQMSWFPSIYHSVVPFTPRIESKCPPLANKTVQTVGCLWFSIHLKL